MHLPRPLRFELLHCWFPHRVLVLVRRFLCVRYPLLVIPTVLFLIPLYLLLAKLQLVSVEANRFPSRFRQSLSLCPLVPLALVPLSQFIVRLRAFLSPRCPASLSPSQQQLSWGET